MKRTFYTLTSALLCFVLVGCTAAPALTASDWKMSVVQSEDGSVIACDANSSDVHPDAAVMEITCSVGDGTIVITDVASGRSWSGRYSAVTAGEGQSLIFEAKFDGGTAYLVQDTTVYSDGTSRDTLIVAGGGYSMTCFTDR